MLPKNIKISLPEKIANDLRLKIIMGSIEKGIHLNEISLSEDYGVSRGSIRQAIAILSNEGLVETLSNGRSNVFGFSITEIEDYYKLRLFIESEAMKKIIQLPYDDKYTQFIDSLSKCIDSIDLSLHPGLIQENFYNSDIEFHYLIVSFSGSQISKQVWRTLSNINRTIHALKSTLLIQSDDQILKDVAKVSASHRKIISCLNKKDWDTLSKELEWHLENSVTLYKSLTQTINSIPQANSNRFE